MGVAGAVLPTGLTDTVHAPQPPSPQPTLRATPSLLRKFMKPNTANGRKSQRETVFGVGSHLGPSEPANIS